LRLSFGHFGKFALGLLASQFFFQLGANLLKGFLSRLADVFQHDDVVAEFGLDQIADGPGFQGKKGIFKWLDHDPAPGVIEVTPFGRRPRVL
jgi:hypothetical protein